FVQGQIGAIYTISVKNVGVGATSGQVSVLDTLPTGLTAAAISGNGWTCTLGTLSCVRSDVLAAGAVYPAITLVVNVDASAPSPVTNIASVSGGGDQIVTNNTAYDQTAIYAVVPVISLVSGNGQSGTVGQTLPSPFVVKITSATGVPASGIPVTFLVVSGNGTLT